MWLTVYKNEGNTCVLCEKSLKNLFFMMAKITKNRVFTSCSNVQPTGFTSNAYVFLNTTPGEQNLTKTVTL